MEKIQPTAECIVARLVPSWGSRVCLLFKATEPYEHYYDENGEEVPNGAIVSWTDVELPPESEDEKIRKGLIHHLKELREWKVGTMSPIKVAEYYDVWIAYLEKQKEPADGDFARGYDCGYECCLHSHGAEWIEKQKEPHYSPLCNTIKDKIREYIANHFIADTVVQTDMKSIVKAMEEGVRLGKEEQKPTLNWRTIEQATTKRTDEGDCVTTEKMLIKGLIDDEDYRIIDKNVMVNKNLLCVPVSELNAKEQKSDKCKGCNNVKGCINCVDGSEWAHIEEKEQKPILEVFGFKVGDAVKLKHGDGRKHIIKSFEKIKGIHGPDFYHVVFEDSAASDHIIPNKDYPNGYYTHMEKLEGEQKPAEGDNETEIQKAFREGKSAGRKEVFYHPEEYGLQKEQKSAEWSEEDEKWFDYFERLLEFGYNKDPHDLGKLCVEGKMWLKSIHPQSKQEWSEADEKNFYWISTRIQQANMTPEYSAKVYEILSWLESLRPRLHWKPSEEQINALWKLMHNAVFLSSWGELEKQIESLYSDLKKLM